MPQVALVARFKAKEGKAEALIAESELIIGEPVSAKGKPSNRQDWMR